MKYQHSIPGGAFILIAADRGSLSAFSMRNGWDLCRTVGNDQVENSHGQYVYYRERFTEENGWDAISDTPAYTSISDIHQYFLVEEEAILMQRYLTAIDRVKTKLTRALEQAKFRLGQDELKPADVDRLIQFSKIVELRVRNDNDPMSAVEQQFLDEIRPALDKHLTKMWFLENKDDDDMKIKFI